MDASATPSFLLQDQLVATKFFVPITPGPVISRPRLLALLDEGVKRTFTLISAPAGFGKTTLLSMWVQSLPGRTPLIAWVSLDKEDNDPRLFWSYVFSALDRQQPHRFSPLVEQLCSPQSPPLKYLVRALINVLTGGKEEFVLILDDYQMISEEDVHATLSYLVEHLPPQLRIILSTRADPPLPLCIQRVYQKMQEVRMEHLRCTVEETRAFFKDVVGMQFPDETIEQVTTRTEGWLVGLQLLRLSLPEQADPLLLLEEASGDQSDILDYLTHEVLRQQSPEMQRFLLSTSILERLTAPLCDSVMQQTGSQHLLCRLEQANVFVVSLDSRRQWYRYHALFAQALRYRLEQTQPDLVLFLHHRASLWYAEHGQTTEAILHAFRAREWQWAADLIEQKSLELMAHTWGASEHQLLMLHHWLEQLPVEVLRSRPRLCLTCAQMLWTTAPHPMLEGWLEAAETTLTASLIRQEHENTSIVHAPQALQSEENLLGQVITWRAFLRSFEHNGHAVLSLCQQALALLSADDLMAHAYVALTQLMAYYASSANDACALIENGLQAISLAQAAGLTGKLTEGWSDFALRDGNLH